MAKIGHYTKAIVFEIENAQKHTKNHSTITLELFCAKKKKLPKIANI